MGVDKTALTLEGQSLLERSVEVARRLAHPVCVADRDGRSELPEDVERCDDGPGAGPVAGLLGAAARHPGANWLVLACDLPLVTAGLLRRLVELASLHPNAAAVVPEVEGRVHPLCASYAPSMIERLRSGVAHGEFSLSAALAARPRLVRSTNDDPRADPVLFASAADLGRPEAQLRDELLNCNAPDDLERARLLLQRRRL